MFGTSLSSVFIARCGTLSERAVNLDNRSMPYALHFLMTMFTRSTILKLVAALLLFKVVWCRSNGPPLPRICAPSISLIPQHEGTAPQLMSTAPFSIEVEEISYVAGATINGMKLFTE